MKRSLLIKSLCFVALMVVTLWAIDSDELPFGAMYLETYSDSTISMLSEEMCFNHFSEYTDKLDETKINSLDNEGIMAVRGGMDQSQWVNSEAPAKYSWANYGIIDVDEDSLSAEVKMLACGGDWSEDGSLWISERDIEGDTLWGPSTHLNDRMPYSDDYVRFFNKYMNNVLGYGDPIEYRIDLMMKVDDVCDTSQGDDSTDVVAVVTYGLSSYGAYDTEFYWPDTILASDCLSSLDTVSIDFKFPEDSVNTVVWYESTGQGNPKSAILSATSSTRANMGVTIDIRTTGERDVYIDAIKISDETGRLLIDSDPPQLDGAISAVFEEYSTISDKILGWYLMDEPAWLNYMPFAHIESLMHEVDPDWYLMTALNEYYFTKDTYLEITDADFIMPDIYVFKSDTVRYFGVQYQHKDSSSYAPLGVLNRHLEVSLPSDDTKDIWYCKRRLNIVPYGG